MKNKPMSVGVGDLTPHRHRPLMAQHGPQSGRSSVPGQLPVSPCYRALNDPQHLCLSAADESVLHRLPALRALRNPAAVTASALATQKLSGPFHSTAALRTTAPAVVPRIFVFRTQSAPQGRCLTRRSRGRRGSGASPPRQPVRGAPYLYVGPLRTMSRELSPSDSTFFRGQMLTAWNWDGGYWHPLNPVERDDLLAFDSARLEELLPETKLHQLLAAFEPDDVLLFREHDPDQLLKIPELPFVYGWSEAMLAPRSMSWLVYWSHEATITFAGATLVAAVKERLPNWSRALWL